MANTEPTVSVYVIVGTERSGGRQVDLGKFFTATDADKHVSRYSAGWHNVTVEPRQEPASAQHPAHASK